MTESCSLLKTCHMPGACKINHTCCCSQLLLWTYLVSSLFFSQGQKLYLTHIFPFHSMSPTTATRSSPTLAGTWASSWARASSQCTICLPRTWTQRPSIFSQGRRQLHNLNRTSSEINSPVAVARDIGDWRRHKCWAWRSPAAWCLREIANGPCDQVVAKFDTTPKSCHLCVMNPPIHYVRTERGRGQGGGVS